MAGFSSNTNFAGYKVEDEKGKLTIEEMNAYVFIVKAPIQSGVLLLTGTSTSRYDMYKDIDEKIARLNKVPYEDKYINGLPIGLKLSNGVTIGE